MDCSSAEFVSLTEQLVKKIAVVKNELQALKIDLVVTVSKDGQVLLLHDDGFVEVTKGGWKIPGRC